MSALIETCCKPSNLFSSAWLIDCTAVRVKFSFGYLHGVVPSASVGLGFFTTSFVEACCFNRCFIRFEYYYSMMWIGSLHLHIIDNSPVSLSLRIDFKILLLVFKALNGQAPAYICILNAAWDPPAQLYLWSRGPVSLQKVTRPSLSVLHSYGTPCPAISGRIPQWLFLNFF